MEDQRLYIIKPLSYWESRRGKAVHKMTNFELDRARQHPQGIIREEENRVLVLSQNPRGYIADQVTKGNVSEVLKRHNEKLRTENKKGGSDKTGV